jgi:manganese transport protein
MATGTLAGQAVMKGFVELPLPRWQRALPTCSLAMGPAFLSVSMFGPHRSNQLLVASQALLRLQSAAAIMTLHGAPLRKLTLTK